MMHNLQPKNQLFTALSAEVIPSGKKAWLRDSFLLVMFMLLSVLSSCQESKMKESKYVWAGAATAPVEYPVEIYEGELTNGEESFYFGPIYGILNQGWENSGKGMGSPDQAINLPDLLQMTWYSIQENKFYTGSWKLDMAKINELWEEGNLNVRTMKREDYTAFLVGLAPGGKVALWADGNKRVLIDTFQARDTSISKESANEDFEHFFRKEYRDVAYNPEKLYGTELYAQLKGAGWPEASIYQKYNKKYTWKFAVEGIQLGPNDYFFYQCFNGERDMPLNTANSNAFTAKAIPNHVYVTWKANETYYWVADLNYKYPSIKQAFEQFSPEDKIEFVFQIDTAANQLNTYLKTGSKQVKLTGYNPVLVKKND